MTTTTGNHPRNHENSPESEDENGEELPVAGNRHRETNRQAVNHMPDAVGVGISAASAGKQVK